MLKRKIAAIMISAYVVGFSPDAYAKNCTDYELCNFIFDNLKDVFADELRVKSTTVSDRKLESIEQISVPNFFRDDIEFKSKLRNLDRSIINTVDIFRTNDLPYLIESVRRYSNDIILSSDKKSTVTDPALIEANKVIFDSDGNPTKDFIKYQGYEKKYTSKLDELAQEENKALKNILQIELEQISRDWNLFGNRTEISSALSIVERSKSEDPRALFQEWLDIIKIDYMSIDEIVYSAIIGTDWISFDFESNNIQRINLEIKSNSEDYSHSGIKHVSFFAKYVPINRNYLHHPFLRSASWSHPESDEIVLSSGRSDSSKNELIRSYISGFILIKNLEVILNSEIRSDMYESISGFDVNQGGLTIQNQLIMFSNPTIIGVTVENLKAIPSNITE